MKREKNKQRQFVVVGLGSFGKAVAESLVGLKKEVLAIDIDEERVQEIAEGVTYAVTADARDEEVLEGLGMNNFDVGIVAIGNNLEASLIVTLMLREAGVKYVIAKAINATQEKALYKIGADIVVLPEEEMGRRVARTIATTHLVDYIQLSEEYGIFEYMCPPSWVGKTALDLNIRQEFGVTILGITRDGAFHALLDVNEVFEDGDIVVFLGSQDFFDKDLEKE